MQQINVSLVHQKFGYSCQFIINAYMCMLKFHTSLQNPQGRMKVSHGNMGEGRVAIGVGNPLSD